MKTPEEIAQISNLLILQNDEMGGVGYITFGTLRASVIWGRNEGEYDHVSIAPKKRTPTWEEMCKVKDMFFYEEEECFQLFPKKSEYVNIAKTCLHIWRKINE